MKSLLTLTAGLTSLSPTLAADAITTSAFSIPASTDASSLLFDLGATPTWATGQYATSLATALYSVQTSFAGRDDYMTIIDAIWSAASKDGGSDVVASMSASYFDWGGITEDAWYTQNVPAALQTQVLAYDSAWDSAFGSVQAKATGTGTATENAAAAPRCTGMAVAGVAALGAAVVGVM